MSSFFGTIAKTYTFTSLFLMFFGLSAFAYMMLNSEVDMLFLLEQSSALPNPMQPIQDTFDIFNRISESMPSWNIPHVQVDNINGGFAFVINFLNGLISFINAIIDIFRFIVEVIPALLYFVLASPVYLISWILNSFIIVISALNGEQPNLISLDFVNFFVG